MFQTQTKRISVNVIYLAILDGLSFNTVTSIKIRRSLPHHPPPPAPPSLLLLRLLPSPPLLSAVAQQLRVARQSPYSFPGRRDTWHIRKVSQEQPRQTYWEYLPLQVP
mmetsp:Transcript_2814/g.3741  ORF Transcript_2814/g.3741 Transcript_2814/m.3741 type:complete len:108 (+) Transcript_2814:246-569(+)